MSGVDLAPAFQLDRRQRLRIDPVRQVVDHADGRVGQSQLAGDDALRGQRHPDQIGVGGDQADLGGRLEARAVGLPVDPTIAQRPRIACLPGGEDLGAPGRVETGHRVAARVVEAADRHLQGDEIVRADEAADAEAGVERADRADRQHPVAAGLEEGAQVGLVIDPVGEDVGVGGAVALQHDRVALGDRGDPCPARAGGAAAEDDGEASHGAILFAYRGHMTDRPSGREESEDERLDRNLGELLQELRVALPGVQVLFAFLLAVPFQQNFTKITPFQEKVYFTTLLCTAISAALLISPTAYHRLTFHLQQKKELVFVSNRLSIAGLGFLALAMTGAVTLITDVLFGGIATAIFGAAAALMFVLLWGVLPLRHRFRLSRDEDRST